jgi:hypothetical protein
VAPAPSAGHALGRAIAVGSARPRSTTPSPTAQRAASSGRASATARPDAQTRPRSDFAQSVRRGLVHRVADHGVLEPPHVPDVAGHRVARRDPDPDVHLAQVGREARRERPARGQRAPGRIGVRGGRAEHGQRGVALELVDPSGVLLHDVDDDGEEPVQQRHDLLRRAPGGQGGGADEVDEQHRDAADLAPEPDLARRRGRARDVVPDMAAEEVPQPLALVQPGDHRVEAGLQLPELGAVVDRDGRLPITVLHAPHGPADGVDGVGDRPRRPDVAQEAEQQGRAGQADHHDAQPARRDVGEHECGDAGQHQPDDRGGRAERPEQQGAHHDTGQDPPHRLGVSQDAGGRPAQDALREQVGHRARDDAGDQHRLPDDEREPTRVPHVEQHEHDDRGDPQSRLDRDEPQRPVEHEPPLDARLLVRVGTAAHPEALGAPDEADGDGEQQVDHHGDGVGEADAGLVEHGAGGQDPRGEHEDDPGADDIGADHDDAQRQADAPTEDRTPHTTPANHELA